MVRDKYKSGTYRGFKKGYQIAYYNLLIPIARQRKLLNDAESLIQLIECGGECKRCDKCDFIKALKELEDEKTKKPSEIRVSARVL